MGSFRRPQNDGNSHVNTTPPAAASAAMGERYLGITMGEYDGGFVWQQQQDMHPNVGGRDSMFQRYLHFYSFAERYVESTGNRLNQLITNMMGAHYPVKSGMYSMTAGGDDGDDDDDDDDYDDYDDETNVYWNVGLGPPFFQLRWLHQARPPRASTTLRFCTASSEGRHGR